MTGFTAPGAQLQWAEVGITAILIMWQWVKTYHSHIGWDQLFLIYRLGTRVLTHNHMLIATITQHV